VSPLPGATPSSTAEPSSQHVVVSSHPSTDIECRTDWNRASQRDIDRRMEASREEVRCERELSLDMARGVLEGGSDGIDVKEEEERSNSVCAGSRGLEGVTWSLGREVGAECSCASSSSCS
jgi:hypothetical protein